MSRPQLKLDVHRFVNGLNTDATSINILPSEFQDGTVNIELLNNDSARRRRAIDFVGVSDNGDTMQEINRIASRINTPQEIIHGFYARLTAPNGQLVERIILDMQNKFYIFVATNTDLKNNDTPLQIIDRGVQSNDDQRFEWMSFDQSGRRVFFAGTKIQPGYLQLLPDDSTFELIYTDVLIRDLQAGSVNTRRTNDSKYYECTEDHTSSAATEPGTGADWEQFWLQLNIPIPTTGTTAWANTTAYTSTIIKRYDKTDVVGTNDTRPTTVAFYAGRRWLGGDPEFPNQALFTRVVDVDRDLETFMQQADPFDEDDSLLADADGGVLSLIGSGTISQMLATTNSIFIGTTTFIHEITGPDGIFKATDFSNTKVVNDSVEGPANMVLTERELVIFGRNNVWRSDVNDIFNLQTGTLFKRLDFERFETFYNNIPREQKAAGHAIYNADDNLIYWLFNDEETNFDSQFNPKNLPGYAKDMLCMRNRFDITKDIQAVPGQIQEDKSNAPIFLYEFADTADEEQPYIGGALLARNIGNEEVQVIDNEDNIIIDNVDNLITAFPNNAASEALLFITLRKYDEGSDTVTDFAFSLFSEKTGTDWLTGDTFKTTFPSKIIFGTTTLGDVLAVKMPVFIFLMFKIVETGVLDENNIDTNEGGAFIQTGMNWTISSDSNKLSSQRQAYFPNRFNYSIAEAGANPHTVAWFKHRMRGRGRVMTVILDNDEEKDFHLLGWTVQFHGKP